MCSGLDDLIYWRHLSQPVLITTNFNSSHSMTAKDSLYFRSHSHSDLIRFCITYAVSRRTHRKYIRCPAMNICEPLLLLLYLQRVEQQRKLSDFCRRILCRGKVFTELLPRNGSTCHILIIFIIVSITIITEQVGSSGHGRDIPDGDYPEALWAYSSAPPGHHRDNVRWLWQPSAIESFNAV
jgi:hypothetical protein